MQYEKSATLSTLQDQTLFQPTGPFNEECLTPWDVQSRRILHETGKWPALYSGEGGGHGYVMQKREEETMQPTICIQGNCIDRADTAGCNGKGWTEDVSYTLNTIDRPAVVHGIPLLDDQGGSSIRGNDNAHVAPTLRAEAHGNIPAIAAGFKYLQGSAAGSIAYALENHPNDSRVKISEDNVVQTLSGRMGTGGGNTPMILECYSQDAYDKYTQNEMSATLKNTGGVYGGGERNIDSTEI